ncbi:hypothetical protein ACV3UL_15890 [Clostridium perfringens]
MNTDFKKMSSDELYEYAISYDFQTYRDIYPENLNWIYIESYLLEELNISDMKNKQDWISWINQEQKIFLEYMSYDKYKEVEEYWVEK